MTHPNLLFGWLTRGFLFLKAELRNPPFFVWDGSRVGKELLGR